MRTSSSRACRCVVWLLLVLCQICCVESVGMVCPCYGVAIEAVVHMLVCLLAVDRLIGRCQADKLFRARLVVVSLCFRHLLTITCLLRYTLSAGCWY
jgi:hypothetical protein